MMYQTLREKIITHAQTEYSSSPHEFSEEQMQLIIDHDCECDHCGKSIFELDDFPEVLVEHKEVLCEECYDEQYLTVCPLCEDSYEKEDMTKYFFITKSTSKEVGKPIGMYEILKHPFYYSDGITDFGFFNDAIRKVSDIDIDEVHPIFDPYSDDRILLDCICPRCAEKYLRKDNFIKADGAACILIGQKRHTLFADYSDEEIHHLRQDLIHSRITFRGILQNANSLHEKKTKKILNL